MTARRNAGLPDTSQPQSHRSRNLWVALSIVVVIVVAVAAWYTFRPASTTPTTAPTSATSPAASAPGTGLANGCLAGPGKTVKALIHAQIMAPHTTLGAIELAGAFDRWATQFPWPSSADAKLASSAFAAKSASPVISDLPAYFSSRPTQTNPSNAGETAGVSYATGRYFIDSASPTKTVVVLGSKVVENGAVSASKARSVTLSMVWESGVWKVSDMSYTMDPQELFDQGTPFVGGC